MEERKFIKLKKEEYGIKEYIKRDLGKGKISKLDIEYTPVGEKIIIETSRPGLIIGRRGEKIEELTQFLKTRFKLENPHIEIKEIENPLYDAQLVADEIAMNLEKMGNLKFKVVAYKKLQEIMRAGALGCEIRTSGKLPSERAKSWRFSEGYLKKAGESSKEINRAQAVALTKTGIIGVKVAIMTPYAKIYDRINVDDTMKGIVKQRLNDSTEIVEGKKEKKSKKKENPSSVSEETENSKIATEVEYKEAKPVKEKKPRKKKESSLEKTSEKTKKEKAAEEKE